MEMQCFITEHADSPLQSLGMARECPLDADPAPVSSLYHIQINKLQKNNSNKEFFN